ncbi:hypothetical protein QM797_17280 [Rhodococcus sp. IEGM 1381]|uniref:hypothetical protein n=1 Tax=Rhodococcus sp. IEGM 1381 TaxID=3047085 RepID=UPI0024B73508|nr:hypothetical protein [Rhodococcus sp. IEGM 1381]MDI9896480.1 hypothetical protein [Rhodococcus sp. IEGM 1381]
MQTSDLDEAPQAPLDDVAALPTASTTDGVEVYTEAKREVPLYAEDGTTTIGVFAIG